MELVAKSVGMQEFSNEHFRLGVFAFDAAHVIAACFAGVDICHGAKLAK